MQGVSGCDPCRAASPNVHREHGSFIEILLSFVHILICIIYFVFIVYKYIF